MTKQELKSELEKCKQENEELSSKFSRFLAHMTGDFMSYVTYDLETMKRVADDYQQEHHLDFIKDDIMMLIKDSAPFDAIEEIKKYLEKI